MTEIELSSADARQLTDKIKIAVEGTWQLIQEAYLSRAWSVLGYASWDEYCTREFGTARLRLPREERQEVVASLRESGLSTRAIAAATGMDPKTVRNDLAAGSGGEISPPALTSVTGADGKSYARSRPAPTPTPTPRPQPTPVRSPEPEPGIWYGGPIDDVPAAEPTPLPIEQDRDDEAADLAEADARRDAELDAELEGTAQRFRANFARAMARSDDVWGFDLARIAEVYASPADRRAVLGWVREMRGWCDRVTEALDKTITLRSVGGDR